MSFKNGLSLAAARREARKVIGDVAKGSDPLAVRRKSEAASDTLRSIADEYLARENTRLRSIDQRRAVLEKLVYPKLGPVRIGDIRRTDVVRLLDSIEDERGPVMADKVLAVLRRLFTWYAGRSDDFRSPIVRGMARTSPKALARTRTLSDEELRALWKAADDLATPFARMVQFILLTGVRRNEAARMDRGEIIGEEWLIPSERFKGKREFLVPLTPAALAVLSKLPLITNSRQGPVFTTDGKRPLSGFSKFKKAFDKRCGVEKWTLHDLRRTARTLMSRAGVDKDHAERMLGHVIGGVRGVYDRHEFAAEKRRALEMLAAQIGRIVDPQPNVIALRGTAPQQLGP